MSETANHRRRDLVPFGLLAAAVLLGALAFAKVASFVRTQRVIAQVHHLGTQDPNDLQASVRKAKESADALKKNNLFVKQAPKEHPVKQVDGILGSEVLIAGKWYKVGEKIGDAEIVAIAPTEVTIAWDGQKKTFAPISATSAAPEPPSKPAADKPEEAKAPEPGKPAPPAPPAEAKAVAPAAANDPLAWLGITLSPKMREILLAKWNSASDEEKEKAKQEWSKMSEGDRQRAIDELERGS
jgi:hypothetical protein